MSKFAQHPLSAAFPSMQADEFQALCDSIGEIGVQNPITIFEGMVIDGWHRYRAANESGMACPSVDLGNVDPREFVLAQNKARRNLSALQRAAAVTSVYKWVASNVGRFRGETVSPLEKTNTELAAIARTTTRTIQQAKLAEKAGLIDAVKDGALSAREVVKLTSAKPEKPVHIEVEDADYSGPSEAELQAAQDVAKADLNTVMELLESDDPKAALLQENERLRMALAATQSQRDGYMNQSNELIRRVKSLRKMLDKAQGK